jgi:hypothetical protein
MATWVSLSSNQAVDSTNLTDAVATGIFVVNAGQTLPNTLQLVTRTQALTWLNLDSAQLPANANQIPTKAQCVAAPQLATPTGLSPEFDYASEIIMQWNVVTNATNYVLQFKTVAFYTQVYSSSAQIFDHTGLSPSTTYTYQVKAQASGYTDSAWSTPVAVTTTAWTTNNFTLSSGAAGIAHVSIGIAEPISITLVVNWTDSNGGTGISGVTIAANATTADITTSSAFTIIHANKNTINPAYYHSDQFNVVSF